MEHVGQVLVETYRLERLIAQGGMATVYEASHVRVPKKFAVKFLRHQLANHAEALQRFRREAEIVATLDHPNIVQLVDYNVADDGQPYIVLELVDGEPLATRQATVGRFSLDETVRVGAQVASALEAAHAAGVIHRDLKPANILLRRDGTVKVVDFGVAKLRRGPELTAMHVVVGTVGYMAPEQVTGAAIDARVDEFALASILWGMLAGEPAFEIDAPVATQATRILSHTPPILDGVPTQVNAVLQRAMAKLPHDRFATVGDFMRALESAASSSNTDRIRVDEVEFDGAARTDADGELPPLANEPTSIAGQVAEPTSPGSPGEELSPLGSERTTITSVPVDSTSEPSTDPNALENQPDDASALPGERTQMAAAPTAMTAAPTAITERSAATGERQSAASTGDERADEAALPETTLRTPAVTETSAPSARSSSPRASATASGTLSSTNASVAGQPSAVDETTIPIHERVTIKPMMAPAELEALRARAQRESRALDAPTQSATLPRSARLVYVVVGVAAGGGVAMLLWFLAHR